MHNNFDLNNFNEDSLCREEKINRFIPLVDYIASKIAMRLPPHIDKNDLVSAGIIGLIDAINKYSPEKQVKFETYAEFRIRGAIFDELRTMDWVPRSIRKKAKKTEMIYKKLESRLQRPATDEEVAREMKINIKSFRKLISEISPVSFLSLDDSKSNDSEQSQKNLLEIYQQNNSQLQSVKLYHKQLIKLVSSLIDSLPKQESSVISMYYYEELNMKEIGNLMKLSESRISQLHNKAIFRLRKKMKKNFKKDLKN